MSTLTFVSLEEAQREAPPIPADGNLTMTSPAKIADYFGRLTAPELPGPQGFLVETMPAESTIGAHWHTVDQFQLIFPAEGAWYLRHPIKNVLLHFADAYTTYGPFGTGPETLSMFTLRSSASTRTGYMPGAADLLPSNRPSRRNYEIDLGAHLGQSPPAGAVVVESLIAEEPDGLAAALAVLGPNASMSDFLDARRSGGRYYTVLRGRCRCDEQVVEHRGLGWIPAGEKAPTITTDVDEVAEVLIMQFPAK